jgi:hypothetical protein
MVGPTKQGTDDLIAKDPLAEWGVDDEGNPAVVNSCVETDSCVDPQTGQAVHYSESPRIVAIPVFDITTYLATERLTGQGEIIVTNILGFFVEDTPGNDVLGRLVKKVEQSKGGAGSVDPRASFIKVIQLVR